MNGCSAESFMADSSQMPLKLEPERARRLTPTFPVGHRLSNEDLEGSEAEWNSVDTLETVGRS
ncbi:hypothetical protein DPMN_085354 [Dreissena polymorpha]|uniref:Uncharacterized protein n=1 Tax=Dreissena polymorpha TaxID=45954 RepID=A0A9D3YFX4_DREPO|nr:hypothetical protein DPMN_085354 [Dreissena polymorpha]